MTLGSRTAGLAAALVAATAVVAPASGQEGHLAPEAVDFAVEALGNPWDYADAGDILTDGDGPTLRTREVTVAGGRLRIEADDDAYVSPLHMTVEGALPEQDGGVATPVDTRTYTRAALQIHASIPGPRTASLRWFTCTRLDQSVCGGGDQFVLEPGWNTVLLGDLENDYPSLPSGWEGTVHGLRLSFDSAGTYEIDWLRLYRPGEDDVVLEGGTGTRWSGTEAAPDAGDRRAEGRIVLDPRDPTASIRSGAFPPGTYTFDGDTTLRVDARPAPVIDDPDFAGGTDYAASVIGDPWDMSDEGDVVAIGNATDVRFDDGMLCATNTSGDPWVQLPVAPGGIDADRYHRLTLRYRYEGEFDLGFGPGGGTHARVLYRTPATGGGWVDSRELVTYTDRDTYRYDLDAPFVGDVADPDSTGPQAPWSGTVTALRVDPNEDPGPRRWCLDEVRLSADDGASEQFRVRWHDVQHEDGTVVAVTARRDGGTGGEATVVRAHPQHAGTNEILWDVRGLLPGRWWLHASATDDHSTGTAVAGGPVRVPLRLAGADRIETGVRLSRNAFPDSAEVAVVATAHAFPDALAAAPLTAAADGGPVLLTGHGDLAPVVAAELARLAPDRVYVLGGRAALSGTVVDRVEETVPEAEVTRLAGPDRAGTAAAVARETARLGAGPTVLVATGTTFADALAAGPLAATAGAPLLLVERDAVPPATAEAIADLDPARVVAVGGRAVITTETLRRAAVGRPTDRLAGPDRWETAARVRAATIAAGGDPGVVLAASGETFADALAAGPAVAARGGALALVARVALPEATRRILAEADPSWLRVAGGHAAVAEGVAEAARAAAGLG